MDFVLGAISNVMRAMALVMRKWSFTRNLADDIATIKPYFDKANTIIPIETALTILGLYMSLQLCLIAYYWITRTINLIRGAG